MNVAFGQRLSEIATDSASMSEPPTTASTQSIPVEEIVYKSKLGYVQRLSKAKMDIEKSFHSIMIKIQTISEVRKAICLQQFNCEIETFQDQTFIVTLKVSIIQ